jgi:hypothetical protein
MSSARGTASKRVHTNKSVIKNITPSVSKPAVAEESAVDMHMATDLLHLRHVVLPPQHFHPAIKQHIDIVLQYEQDTGKMYMQWTTPIMHGEECITEDYVLLDVRVLDSIERRDKTINALTSLLHTIRTKYVFSSNCKIEHKELCVLNEHRYNNVIHPWCALLPHHTDALPSHECVCCYEYMQTPIMICANGHHVCRRCLYRFHADERDTCLMCRTPIDYDTDEVWS